jgi:hypothetical protein
MVTLVYWPPRGKLLELPLVSGKEHVKGDVTAQNDDQLDAVTSELAPKAAKTVVSELLAFLTASVDGGGGASAAASVAASVWAGGLF